MPRSSEESRQRRISAAHTQAGIPWLTSLAASASKLSPIRRRRGMQPGVQLDTRLCRGILRGLPVAEHRYGNDPATHRAHSGAVITTARRKGRDRIGIRGRDLACVSCQSTYAGPEAKVAGVRGLVGSACFEEQQRRPESHRPPNPCKFCPSTRESRND